MNFIPFSSWIMISSTKWESPRNKTCEKYESELEWNPWIYPIYLIKATQRFHWNYDKCEDFNVTIWKLWVETDIKN